MEAQKLQTLRPRVDSHRMRARSNASNCSKPATLGHSRFKLALHYNAYLDLGSSNNSLTCPVCANEPPLSSTTTNSTTTRVYSVTVWQVPTHCRASDHAEKRANAYLFATYQPSVHSRSLQKRLRGCITLQLHAAYPHIVGVQPPQNAAPVPGPPRVPHLSMSSQLLLGLTNIANGSVLLV
jgi:hypothetical protein